MGWRWTRDGKTFVAVVPAWVGTGTARAERHDDGWALQVGGWHTRIVNPRLRSWLTAREIVEIVVRCHFQGAVAVNSTGAMMVPAGS